MAHTVTEQIAETLAAAGVKRIYGIQAVNARDAEHTARLAYADVLAHGRPHSEARHAYFVGLWRHAAADPQRLSEVDLRRTRRSQ